MTGTAIVTTWRSMRPAVVAVSCQVRRFDEPRDAKQLRLGGLRVPG